MPEFDHFTGRCPKCGEALQIPSSLKQFSCMYCGARLTPEELVVEAAPQEPVQETVQTDGAAGAAYYRENILRTVADYPGIERELTKNDFVPAFERYSQGTGEIFRQLDLAVAAGAMTLEEAAAEFLDQLEPRWNKNGRRNVSALDKDKFVIAIFMVPMVRKMALPISEAYCQILRDQWCSRYPKSPFNLGDYDTIVNGFRKKYLGLCFITTAVCREEGKPDDCAELTAFRAFRDGYLQSCPDGPALIAEYYKIAPCIVARIDLSTEPAARYARIRKEYLGPCYEDIQTGRLAQCKERYVRMVRDLEQEYLS